MSKKPVLYLLDANSLLHRAWHAIPPLTRPDGMIVNAVFGVLNITLKLLQEKKPDACVAAWDTKAPTFRHDAYAAYKATRKKQPDELYDQIPLVEEGLSYLGIPSLALDGFEADDIIGTLAKKYVKKGWHIVIVTSDRDLLQLIEPNVEVLAFKRGVTETILYDAKKVREQYGLSVSQFVEYKAMRGDPSDNIPGVKGIGDKTATQLLQNYKNLQGIFKVAHDEHSLLKPGVRMKLLEAEDRMDDILDLVRIHTRVRVKYVPKKGSVAVLNSPVMLDFLKRMDFNSLVKRLNFKNATNKKKKKSTQTFVEITQETEALKKLRLLKKSRKLVVCIDGGGQTLFTNSISTLGLYDGKCQYIFSGDCLSSKKCLRLFQELFDDSDIHKITHDAKSVMKLLMHLSLQIRAWHFDTMLAAYLIGAGERNHELYVIAEKFDGIRMDADASLSQKMHAIFRLTKVLERQLREEKLTEILLRFELPLIPILFDMEIIGIKIDIDFLKSFSRKLTKEQDRLKKSMIQLAGKDFNPASPIQLADVLFEVLKLPTKGIKKGKTGYSTAASELFKLHGLHKIISDIEKYREISKLLSTYIDVLPGLADTQARIHTTFQQAVTSTGRLSSTHPNLQNIPIRSELGREIRGAFVAKQGFSLLACDYSQIELRIAAALSNDAAMTQAFIDGKDIHTETAASIWGVSSESVTKEQRRVAKAINFGILFGQGPMGLSRTADISFSDAKEFIQVYFQTYPALASYLDHIKAFTLAHGFAETYFGRRRLIPEIHSHMHQVRAQGERMAINMPIQGTEADIIKLAMIAVKKNLSHISKDARMLLQVHDELLFEVPSAKALQLGAYVKKVMEGVCDLGVPILVDVKHGKNWGEMKNI